MDAYELRMYFCLLIGSIHKSYGSTDTAIGFGLLAIVWVVLGIIERGRKNDS